MWCASQGTKYYVRNLLPAGAVHGWNRCCSHLLLDGQDGGAVSTFHQLHQGVAQPGSSSTPSLVLVSDPADQPAGTQQTRLPLGTACPCCNSLHDRLVGPWNSVKFQSAGQKQSPVTNALYWWWAPLDVFGCMWCAGRVVRVCLSVWVWVWVHAHVCGVGASGDGMHGGAARQHGAA